MKATFSIFLSVLSLASASESSECRVTFNGEDKTSEFFLVDSTTGEQYVDCVGSSKCREAVIENCPVIRCGENESCNNAQIINFTDYVTCEGTHSCHRANMTASDDANAPIVHCSGGGACDVAIIKGRRLDEVTCTGPKACRKVHIEGARIVRCHEGHESAVACEGSATFETECLYCGKNGCADYINMCKYKILTGEESESGDKLFESDGYQKCATETLIGTCPDALKTELHKELTGLEEIELDAIPSDTDAEEESVIEQIEAAEGIDAMEAMAEIDELGDNDEEEP